MKKKKLLFVCMCNLNRSPTFEKFFKKHLADKYEVKSTGTEYGYPERFTEKLLTWADTIYVMDLEQVLVIHRRFNKFMHKVKIIGVSDQYNPDDPSLIRLIRFWYNELNMGEEFK